MGFETRFANAGTANLTCTIGGCGVPKKLLCLKNGKYVKDSAKCRKIWNKGTCDPCRKPKCVFKRKRVTPCECVEKHVTKGGCCCY